MNFWCNAVSGLRGVRAVADAAFAGLCGRRRVPGQEAGGRVPHRYRPLTASWAVCLSVRSTGSLWLRRVAGRWLACLCRRVPGQEAGGRVQHRCRHALETLAYGDPVTDCNLTVCVVTGRGSSRGCRHQRSMTSRVSPAYKTHCSRFPLNSLTGRGYALIAYRVSHGVCVCR
jgi:hypothetical protein